MQAPNGSGYLDETGPAVERQMNVLDLAEVGELVVNVILLRLLVHARGDDDEALDRCNLIIDE